MCGRLAGMCGRLVVVCGRLVVVCGRLAGMCGRSVVVCGRLVVVCGRLVVVCGRLVVVCGRFAEGGEPVAATLAQMTGSAPWSIVARNLPDHASNPIHTDAGARAAGFPRALVAGVTTYTYCVHPIAEHWGIEWARSGSAEVSFASPVFDTETLSFPVTVDADDGLHLEVRVDRSDRPLVRVDARRCASLRPVRSPGETETLEPMIVDLDGEFDPSYAARAGDDLDLFRAAGVVHPGVWPRLANHMFHEQLVNGAWIHTRSHISHHALAPLGANAVVRGLVFDRFVRRGLRAVADVEITVEGVLVASIEHEAIIDVTVTE